MAVLTVKVSAQVSALLILSGFMIYKELSDWQKEKEDFAELAELVQITTPEQPEPDATESLTDDEPEPAHNFRFKFDNGMRLSVGFLHIFWEGWLGYFLGGCDGLLIALVAFVVIDYITGVMCAAADKKLSSEVGDRSHDKVYDSRYNSGESVN